MGLGMTLRRALAGTAAGALATANLVAPQTKQQIAREAREQYQKAIDAARTLLMTGPRATPPRPSTIRRFLMQHKLGVGINQGSRVRLPDGTVLHPTKGFRAHDIGRRWQKAA